MDLMKDLINKARKDIDRKTRWNSDENAIKEMCSNYISDLKRVVIQNIPSEYDIMIIQCLVEMISEDLKFPRNFANVRNLKEILELYSWRKCHIEA